MKRKDKTWQEEKRERERRIREKNCGKESRLDIKIIKRTGDGAMDNTRKGTVDNEWFLEYSICGFIK